MKNVKFICSFRFKLILVLVLLIQIPLATFSFLLFTWVKEIINDKFSESAIQSIRENTKNIDFLLNDFSNFSNIILTNKNFIDLIKNKENAAHYEIESLIRGFFTSRDDIEGIYIYSGQNNYSIGLGKTIVRNDEAEWYKDLLQSEGEVKWINTRHETMKTMSGDLDKYYFSLGRKLVDILTLEELGVLLIDVSEDILEKSYKAQIIADDVEAFICDAKGNIISHTDKSQIGSNVDSKPFLNNILSNGQSYGKFLYKTRTQDLMVIYSTSSITGWKLIQVIPNSYLYREINKITSVFIIISIALTVFSFLIALFLSARLAKPIVNLMKTMEEAENGNLDVKINIKRVDEIGQLGLCFNNMISKIKSLVNKILEEERLKKEIELEALHAQINPHFLYNTLNSIKWMAKMQGAKNISSTVTALVKLLRISINLSHEMICLEDEIEYVKNYVLIQKVRFNEQFEVSYKIEENCRKCKIPKLILQPIVENSIVHGFKEEGGTRLNIEIKAYSENGLLTIQIADDGSGIEEDILNKIFKTKNANKFSEVGLNNVNERIKLYFGESFGIKITSEINKGTCVMIALPYIVENEEKGYVQGNDCG